MNDDVDDIFEIQSSPEQLPDPELLPDPEQRHDPELLPEPELRPDPVERPHQNAPEVIEIDTSPIIVNLNRSQRRTTRARSRNIINQIQTAQQTNSENVIEAMDTNSEVPRDNENDVEIERNEDVSVRAGQLLDEVDDHLSVRAGRLLEEVDDHLSVRAGRLLEEVDDHLHNINNQIITSAVVEGYNSLLSLPERLNAASSSTSVPERNNATSSSTNIPERNNAASSSSTAPERNIDTSASFSPVPDTSSSSISSSNINPLQQEFNVPENTPSNLGPNSLQSVSLEAPFSIGAAGATASAALRAAAASSAPLRAILASSSLTAIQPEAVASSVSAVPSVISASDRSVPLEASSSSVPSTASVPLASTTSTTSSQPQAERSPYFAATGTEGRDSGELQTTRSIGLNESAADFQGLQPHSPEPKGDKKEKKKSKAKKRKAIDSVEDDNDDGSCCTICFEAWSNSGEHRISSLRCGHFFGYTCIEKWLKGSGSSCPNCNEKSTKKDIRVHYVSKLKALDTSEKDRALADLEKEKTSNRELQLRVTENQIRNKLLQEEIEKLQREVHQYRKFRGDLPAALQSTQQTALPTQPTRLVYQRRYEIVRGNEKTCRILAYSEYNGMLLISQPSFTALAPGYGVRQFNVLDMKVGNFVSLCKEQIRDLSFSCVSPHLLLSCGHDRSVRITNISNGNRIVEFSLEHQVWACDWAANNDYQIFLGTNKGTILVHDTRHPTNAPQQLTFPTGDTKPIIGLRNVPARPDAGFPQPGFLVMNLTSLWYWYPGTGEDNTWECSKLNIEQRLLWSLDFDPESFLVLVGCKPSPLASHIVLELNSTMIESGRAHTVRTVMVGKGGSYNARSFLRSALLPSPNGQVYLAFSKGTGQSDHKVIIQEVGSDRVMQELKVDRPILDIKQMKLNDDRYLALLSETELNVYKWNQVES